MIEFYNIESHNKQLTPEEVTQEPATDPEAEKLQTIADKITAIFAPWDIENATPAEIIEETKRNPYDTILFLLDYIENQ